MMTVGLTIGWVGLGRNFLIKWWVGLVGLGWVSKVVGGWVLKIGPTAISDVSHVGLHMRPLRCD